MCAFEGEVRIAVELTRRRNCTTFGHFLYSHASSASGFAVIRQKPIISSVEFAHGGLL
jgi:hypothetical protein